MKVRKCNTGMIFLLNDKTVTPTEIYNVRHNYIIISSTGNGDEMIQAMSISSMKNKSIDHLEVPIVLGNGYISYIIPYNIHSFNYSEIMYENFKGCIYDNDYITANDFIKMLMNIYVYSKGVCTDNSVLEQYKNYCKWFYKTYNNIVEYRNRFMLQPLLNTPMPKRELKPTHREHKEPIITKKHNKILKEIDSHDIRRSSNKDIRERIEEDELIESELNSSECIVNNTSQYKDISSNKSLFYSIKMPKDVSDVIYNKRKEEINKINTFPEFIKDWSDEELMYVVELVKEYTPKGIYDYTDDYPNLSYVYKLINSVYKEISKRGIDAGMPLEYTEDVEVGTM